MCLIPGLLQTPDYIRSVLTVNPEREWMIQMRLARQELLTAKNAPEVHFVIEESVLRRPIGSREILHHQLEHLVRMGAQPNISIRVLPMNDGMSSGLDGSFMLLEFPADELHAYVEAPGPGVILTRPADLEIFVTVVDELDSFVLDEQRSALLMTELAEDLPYGRGVLA